jgi:uncharacterized protein (DUF983 family)
MSSSKLVRILGMRCPRCGKGDLFETGAFSFKKPFDMPDHCPQCRQPYFPEPGFYYGAMFVSYVISGFFCLGFLMFFHWVLDWNLELSFFLLIVVGALLFVYLFRISRSIWLGLMVKKGG